jgi:hypothetical protein
LEEVPFPARYLPQQGTSPKKSFFEFLGEAGRGLGKAAGERVNSAWEFEIIDTTRQDYNPL